MISLVIIFIITLMVVNYGIEGDIKKISLPTILMSLFITIVFGSLLLKLFAKIATTGEYTKKSEYELISINDGQSNIGNFCIGSGYIEDKLVYTYYRKDFNSGIVRRSISSNLTTIYEVDSTEKPKLIVKTVPLLNKNLLWLPFYGISGYQKYDLYLPKGSIIKEIKLDNQ